MESVDRLRALASDIKESEIRNHSVISSVQGTYSKQLRLDINHEWLDNWHVEFDRLADAIEAEVAERYAPLLVGKDDKPIRPGDTVYGSDDHEWRVTYIRIGRNHSVRATDGTESKALRAEWLSHVKPPTVEDVIDEIADKAANYTGSYHDGGMSCDEYIAAMQLLVKDYAAKLRLAGGDE